MLRGLTPIVLETARGRLRLRLTCLPMGEDLCVTLTGGDREHLGAVALAGPGGPPAALTVPGHREADLASELASRLSDRTGRTVCVACGIHLDRITPSEIQDVHDLSIQLAKELGGRLEAPGKSADEKVGAQG